MTQKQRRNYREQADKFFSQYIRLRDGTCRVRKPGTCRGDYRLQCAHIHSRQYAALRVDERNAVAACSACHYYYTPRYIEWEDWVDSEFGDGYYQTLKREARHRVGERQDWKTHAAFWREAAEQTV